MIDIIISCLKNQGYSNPVKRFSILTHQGGFNLFDIPTFVWESYNDDKYWLI